MSHSHAHSHGRQPGGHGRAFAIGVSLNIVYVLIEGAYGFWSNSLALLADAGHNLSDVLGLLLAWAGYALSQLGASDRRTYGWRGTSILAALFNALLLLVAVGGIVWEAAGRFLEPVSPETTTVMIVASIGVVINTITALLFMRGGEHDLNLRGAFLHMAADAAVSLGVVLAALAIRQTGWQWLDPATSLAIAVVIFLSTWNLLKESFNLSIQAVPKDIDVNEVRLLLAGLPGVEQVHDLHVWAMSTTQIALTAHLLKPTPDGDDDLLRRAARELHDRFGIEHVTIQLERTPGCIGCPC
ncbi:MAG: cation transporter [Bdellovibrionales bacterium]|nr:cation transporter [Bdellovibrionales bacterium]